MAEQVAAAMNQSQSDSELSESVDGEESDSSSSSSSASSSSTTTSEGDADALELAKISNEVLRLPRGLCENADVFREFFSLETWRMLPEQLQAQLHEHLPGFSRLLPPDEAALEHERSIAMLFSGQMQCFGRSPLVDLQRQLEEGNCRPDVLKLRESITKSQRREQRFQTCERLSQLAKQLFVSREQLLRSAYKSAPDTVLKSERTIRRRRKQLSGDTKLCAVRARKRFHAEVEKLSEQLGVCVSADEEDKDDFEADLRPNEAQSQNNGSMDDGAPALKIGSTSTDKCIYGTLFKRRHELPDEDVIRADQHAKQPRLSNRNFRQYLLDHKRRKLTEPALPDFETSDIRLRDVCARAQMGGSFKRVFASGKTPGRKPKSKLNEPPALVPLPKLEPIRKTELHTNKASLFMDHKSMTATNSQTFADELNNSLQRNFEVCQKQELSDKSSLIPDDDSDPFNIMDGDVELQQEEVETYGTCEETIPAFVISNEIVLPQTKQSNEQEPNILIAGGEGSKPPQQQSRIEFHNLTMENLPKLEPIGQNKAKILASPRIVPTPALAPLKKISSSATNTAYVANPELIQETHACFFSLIRDFFCATPHHRMKFEDLKEKINVWLCNPITALNDWYALAENWSSLLTSAINFLAGDFAEQPDEYVPYIEFKTQLSIYQWIGASRDSDSRLSSLCTYWMQRRNEMSDKPTEQQKHMQGMEGMGAALLRRRSTEIEDASNYDSGIAPPPPPRCPTTWTIRAATHDEVLEFQRQERERFEHPHRAFTYRMHGYESVVGPVKGIYSQILALTKARGHSMMIGDRPNFVTILTLVRDATARLPNGEGTRADISELLKCSQYINRDAAENVLQTIVSGALDRMHTEHDPCVRYDPKRKIWIYLHRNRSVDEFERMHQQHQGLSKHKKPSNRKQKSSKLLSKDGSDMEAMTAGVLTDSSSNHGTASVTIAQNVSNTFSLPALVPANPIIVNSQNISNHHHQPVAAAPPQQSQVLPKCPPVPPLKYNIPNQGNQQQQNQQKSLLKTTFHAQRIEKAVETSEGSPQQQQQHHQLLAHPNQRNQLRIITTSSGLSTGSVSMTNAVSTKHFSFSVPQAKNSSANSNTISSTTPIIVATPTGLQTVHVSNATSVTPPQGSAASPATATLGGKKVALNKPIIINQITQQQTTVKTKSPQIAKQLQQHQQTHATQQQQQQQHSLFIPITMGNPAVGGASTFEKEPQTRNIQTIFMDNSAQLISSSGGDTSMSQQQAKNIIRIVPASAINTGGGTGIKTLVAATSNKQQQQQPVQIIGQRIIANTTVRPQQKTVGGISIISSNANATAGVQGNTGSGGGAIVKMTPQAFASFQQKQGQHILVKQAVSSTQQQQQQQRLVVGNTAIIAQSSQGGGGNKNILVQQLPQTLQKATIVNQAGSSVGSQTSGGALNISSGSSNKIQTINASNLTPQQQRVLLQNLKQQQQIQFKTVQQQQQQQHVVEQQAHRNQGLTILPPQQQRTVTQQAGKTVAVVVSQPQGLTRILKTTVTSSAQQQQHQQQLQQQHIITQTTAAAANDSPSSGTRLLTSSTGQIISLESLLQKQGGAIRITGGNKSGNQTTTTNLIQLASSGAGGQQGQAQYAVVSQPRNIISLGTPHRLITTQAGNSNSANVLQTTTVHAKETTSNTKVVASTTAGGGRIFATHSGNVGQVHTVPQHQQQTGTKIFGKTTVVSAAASAAASGTTSVGGNIRVINAGTRGPATFNIANIQGKQLVFATKPASGVGGNVKNITTVSASQAQQLQNAGVIFGGQTVKIQGNANMQQLSKGGQLIATSQHQPTSQMQTVIMGNQILRVQQIPQQMKTGMNRIATTTVTNTHTGTVAVNSVGNEAILNSNTMPKTFVLGSASGQAIRLQSAAPMQSQVTTVKNVVVPTSQQQGTVAKTTPASRVVLAVQGGGQIFLSPSFQGGSLNLKSLQNMKVVSLAQQQQHQASTTSKDAQQQQLEKQQITQKLTTQQHLSILKNSDSGSGVG